MNDSQSTAKPGVPILGIADGQTSGACVVCDGQIISAINEERIVRLKQARGFPRKSIEEAIRLAGLKPGDIGGVAIAGVRMRFREEIDGWPGWFEARAAKRDGVKDLFFKAASKFGGIVPFVPGIRTAYYGMRAPMYASRRARIKEICRQEFDIPAPVAFYHHHFAHATSAYYTSNFEDALVVTLDGGGDGHCGHIYSVRGGQFEKLQEISSYDSLGNYYAYVTALCGYKAKRHEGKITGLAAHGEPIFRDLLASMIEHRHGTLRNKGRVLFNTALDHIRSLLPQDWQHKDLACSIQLISEDISRDLVSYWVRKTGHRNVALAGGLFANVRINQEVHELPGVEQTFVHPGMGDEGLFTGSALAMDYENAALAGKTYEPRSLPHVYLGTDIDERDCEDQLHKNNLKYERPTDIAACIADKLCEGKVVARAIGRMEYGPRALGNRTIMYQPNDASANDWLNTLLKRTEFMPFAPASTWESAAKLYCDTKGATDTSRYMTITFNCTDWMREHCPGVVHIDGTARPQLVRREDNAPFYDIIKAYEQRTGVPVIVNTSFNIHEEPIVRTAHDAIRAFLDSKLDYLQLGPFVVEGPVGSSEVRRQWKSDSRAAAIGTR